MLLLVQGLTCTALAKDLAGSPAGESPAAPVTVAEAASGLEDAERFRRLVEDTGWRPSAGELQARYLKPGSPALHAFARTRIGNGEALEAALAQLRPDYRKAVDHCLPAARALQPRLPALLDTVATGLGVDEGDPQPSVVFLFGAARSAGTVLDDTVIMGLEVVCRFLQPDADIDADTGADIDADIDADTDANAEDLLTAFLLHELVHVHQLRRQTDGAEDSLLRQALLEGSADLVTYRLLGDLPPPALDRAAYGERHEAALWLRFREDMTGKDLGAWMYGPGHPGEPADLGYWIGLRIAERFLEGAEDQDEALRQLLDLRDPFALLEASGYSEEVSTAAASP